ncbi:MAG TPA: AI-2E family transporter [Anaerolineae bacterium]|nr:AI-2E family transporter [Anaerolineae bacterium]
MTSSREFSPALRIILLLAGASIALWGMSQYAEYILSLSFAFLIALATDPLVNWLRRKGVHRGLILAIALVAVYLVLALLALLLIYGAAQFLSELPTYAQQAQQLVAQWQAALQNLGLASAGSTAIASQADPSKPLNWIADLLSALGSAIGSATTLILLTTFLFVDIILWPGRLEETARRGHSYARRLMEFTVDLRQYIVVMVIVGTCIGALNTVMFYLFGVPFAALWGVLSGILNFIPFIGFWLGLIPPAILTLLEFGPQRLLVLAILYVAINGFVQNVIQPRLVVTRLNLTPFLNLVSATFWPLVLGPAGAIVGVPLTMAVRALILEADPATRWVAGLTSSQLPEPPVADQVATTDHE